MKSPRSKSIIRILVFQLRQPGTFWWFPPLRIPAGNFCASWTCVGVACVREIRHSPALSGAAHSISITNGEAEKCMRVLGGWISELHSLHMPLFTDPT